MCKKDVLIAHGEEQYAMENRFLAWRLFALNSWWNLSWVYNL